MWHLFLGYFVIFKIARINPTNCKGKFVPVLWAVEDIKRHDFICNEKNIVIE